MAKPYFVHESSYIDAPCSVGAGCKIWHFSHVMSDCVIGENCTIGQNVMISSGCRIGANVKIQNNVSIYAGVVLEDDVFCGPSMVFTNVINPRSQVSRKHEFQTTLVKRGATIGANATVVCGLTIGRYAFVGAGSVVTHDVPDFALVYGNPARVRGWVCACGCKLELMEHSASPDRAKCRECGSEYCHDGDQLLRISSDGNGAVVHQDGRSADVLSDNAKI